MCLVQYWEKLLTWKYSLNITYPILTKPNTTYPITQKWILDSDSTSKNAYNNKENGWFFKCNKKIGFSIRKLSKHLNRNL